MRYRISFPEFQLVFDGSTQNASYQVHGSVINSALKQILPEHFFEQKGQSERVYDNLRKKFLTLLPLVKATKCENVPGTMSFFCLFRYRINSFKIFFDLIVHWLIPGKRLDVDLIYAIDFHIPELNEDPFTLCELMIRVDKLEDLQQIERNFPIIESDVRLGVSSSYYAKRILEIKGLVPDQKTTMIQDYIASLVRRMPKMFDSDIFSEMQHALVICHDNFKLERSVRDFGRIISAHYLFRKVLLTYVKDFPRKRNIILKLFQTKVSFQAEPKKVLSIIVGLNFLRDKEVFEQRHLVEAIKQYIPNAQAIEESFYANRRGSEQIITVYLEIEKGDHKDFSSEEIAILRRKLPNDLKNHIGRLTLPVFMPRNEEEIMRNILSLGAQIKYLRDIPQVFISFDEQTDRNLFFTVIFVRVMTEDKKPIQDLFKGTNSFLRYIPDRTKIVGYLRKYPKEANVFRVKFAKDGFLRGDHSIDLYKARQAVVNELNRVLGEFRDFNGGMIAKQNELLTEVRSYLSKEGAKYNEILLENFFYSLAPVIMRTVLEPHAFKSLFEMLLESLDKGVPVGARCSLKMKSEPNFCFALMTAPARSVLDEFAKTVSKQPWHASELVQGYVKTAETVCVGYIYRCTDINKQIQFQHLLETAAQKSK